MGSGWEEEEFQGQGGLLVQHEIGGLSPKTTVTWTGEVLPVTRVVLNALCMDQTRSKGLSLEKVSKSLIDRMFLEPLLWYWALDAALVFSSFSVCICIYLAVLFLGGGTQELMPLFAACGLLAVWPVGSSSLTRDQTRNTCVRSAESLPLNQQGSPRPCLLG